MTDQIFPPEIFEQIFKNLGEQYANSTIYYGRGDSDLLATLLALSRVSRAFYTTPIGYVFRKVHVGDEGLSPRFPERIANLLDLMTVDSSTGRQGIAPYIKEFSIGVSGRGQTQTNSVDVPEVEDELSETGPSLTFIAAETKEQQTLMTLLGDKNLSKVLDALHGDDYGIENFSFQINTIKNVIWSDLPDHLRTSLRSITLSPHLRALNFYRISRLPPTFWNGTYIKDLRLSNMDLFEEGLPAPTVDRSENTAHIPKFECLFTDHAFKFDLSPSTSPLTNLKRLKAYSILEDHYRRTDQILKMSAATLEEIRLEYSGELHISPENTQFSTMPNLKKLSIFHFRSFGMRYTDPMDPSIRILCQMLDPPNPIKVLESLHLELHFNEVNVRDDFLQPKQPDSHWELIDKIVASDRYPKLKKVHLEIYCDLIVGQSRERVFEKKRFIKETTKKLRPAFGRINASERIKFKISVNTSVLQEGTSWTPPSDSESDLDDVEDED